MAGGFRIQDPALPGGTIQDPASSIAAAGSSSSARGVPEQGGGGRRRSGDSRGPAVGSWAGYGHDPSPALNEGDMVSCRQEPQQPTSFSLYHTAGVVGQEINFNTDMLSLMEGDRYCTVMDDSGVSSALVCNAQVTPAAAVKFSFLTVVRGGRGRRGREREGGEGRGGDRGR